MARTTATRTTATTTRTTAHMDQLLKHTRTIQDTLQDHELPEWSTTPIATIATTGTLGTPDSCPVCLSPFSEYGTYGTAPAVRTPCNHQLCMECAHTLHTHSHRHSHALQIPSATTPPTPVVKWACPLCRFDFGLRSEGSQRVCCVYEPLLKPRLVVYGEFVHRVRLQRQWCEEDRIQRQMMRAERWMIWGSVVVGLGGVVWAWMRFGY